MTTELGSIAEIMDEMQRLGPAEILTSKAAMEDLVFKEFIRDLCSLTDPEIPVGHPPDRAFEIGEARKNLLSHFRADTLEGFGIEGFPEAIKASGALLYYLQETQETGESPAYEVGGQEPIAIPDPLSHITTLSYYTAADYMVLDESTKRNLELTKTLRDSKSKGSLFWLIDMTSSPMGARTLLHWLNYPLLDIEKINTRLDAVESSYKNHALRLDLRDVLSHITDLERLTARVSTGSAHARDLIAVRETLKQIPIIKKLLCTNDTKLFQEIHDRLDPLLELSGLLSRALVDDPPSSLRDGGIIRPGYSKEVDELSAIRADAKSVMAGMEATERKQSGISNLKIKYNKVFGYYLEVSKANVHLVPEHYTRKQTLVNAERYITPELKELESKVLGAEDRLIELHYDLFCELRKIVAQNGAALRENSAQLGKLDAIQGLSELAALKRFVRPEINDSDRIQIVGGWHPVIAELVKNERFVPNDVSLDNDENQVLIITGPNMAGKSTVLRQTAIISILSQLGSFVPAEEAQIGVVDRIFTRVGASDILVRGMSTFMVEMTETANILHNATDKSLVLLDEIGRGTSTFDGLSIAWAVAEYLHDTKGQRPKTMFATHYHELVDLAETKKRIKNYHVLVKEWEGEVIFLRKMVQGSTSRSYGIQVARLAGLPAPVIERAKEILVNLESVEHDPDGQPMISKSSGKRTKKKTGPAQLSFFGVPEPPDPLAEKILAQLRNIDTGSLTPIEALVVLDELIKKNPSII